MLFILRGDFFPLFESSFSSLSPKWALISSENPHLLEVRGAEHSWEESWKREWRADLVMNEERIRKWENKSKMGNQE